LRRHGVLRQPGHDRDVAVLGAVIAQSPVGVEPPGQHLAGAGQSQGVETASPYRRDLGTAGRATLTGTVLVFVPPLPSCPLPPSPQARSVPLTAAVAIPRAPLSGRLGFVTVSGVLGEVDAAKRLVAA